MTQDVSVQHFEKGLSRGALRRLVVSFILREQKSREKQGLIRFDQALTALIVGRSPTEIDDIAITEDSLGFDSLGTLELILALNRFFDLNRSGIEDYLLIHRRIGDWVDLLSKHREIVGADWRFGFETSGSTGTPAVVSHSADTLWAEMRAQGTGPFSHIQAPGRIITLVPPHHIYGFLFGCILPDQHGMDVLDLHYAGPGTAFRHARSGDLVVGTPFNWDMLNRTGLRFVDGVFGVTSAGPSTPQTWNSVAACNLAGLTEVFGSTETGGIGTRCAPETPFELLPHVVAQGEHVFRCTDRTPLALQDRLEWFGPDTFKVVGRLDKVVQVAGVNVSPNFVRDNILAVDGVADAAVRMGKDRLRAFVVPRDGVDTQDLQSRLQAHLQKTLDAPARPGCITFGAELPRNDMGKAAAWA
ncbi:MAG: 4-coumarate--CoA ligase [Pseudomonadota bacterium]